MSNFGSAFKENQYILSNQIMQVMLANDPSTLELTGMSEIYLNISEAVFKHLEENKDNKRFYLRFNSLAATICNNVILVSLREVRINENEIEDCQLAVNCHNLFSRVHFCTD